MSELIQRIARAVPGIVLLAGLPALAGENTDWGWFRATSTGSNWWVTQGKATASIAGSAFSAELRDGGSDPFVRVTLRGTIRDRDVAVTATVLQTDKPEETLAGRLRRLCWKAGGGREVLVLTDGVEVISLVRELPKDEACKPAA